MDIDLVHDDDDYLECLCSGIRKKNVLVYIDIVNPENDKWVNGILFRRTGKNEGYRLHLANSREWVLSLVTNDPFHFSNKNGGEAEIINTGNGESNKMIVIVEDSVTYLFINNHFIGVLNTKDKIIEGDVCVCAEMMDFGGEGVTRVNRFEVWTKQEDQR